MKFKLSCSVGLLALICASNSVAGPLSRRSAVTLQVLNDSVDKKLGCSATQIAILRGAIADAIPISIGAATTLSQPNVVTTEGVKTFLGSITEIDLASQVPRRFTNVAHGLSGQLTEITDLDEGNSAQTLRFYCPAKGTTEAEGNPCQSTSDAVAENFAEGSSNKIALCPSFFAGVSRATDVESYEASRVAEKLSLFGAPGNPGHILIHEAQHSIPLLGGSRDDVLNDLSDAKPSSCLLLSKGKRAKNAENWALVSFVINADPGRFVPCTTQPEKRATGVSSCARPSPSKSASTSTTVTSQNTATTKSVPRPSATAKPPKPPTPVIPPAGPLPAGPPKPPTSPPKPPKPPSGPPKPPKPPAGPPKPPKPPAGPPIPPTGPPKPPKPPAGPPKPPKPPAGPPKPPKPPAGPPKPPTGPPKPPKPPATSSKPPTTPAKSPAVPVKTSATRTKSSAAPSASKAKPSPAPVRPSPTPVTPSPTPATPPPATATPSPAPVQSPPAPTPTDQSEPPKVTLPTVVGPKGPRLPRSHNFAPVI